jgi:hypothetical protein
MRHAAGVRIVEPAVDLLPEKLWRQGNLYALPGGNWHFYVGAHPRLGWSVRTVEWQGREIARGRRAFDFAAHEADT